MSTAGSGVGGGTAAGAITLPPGLVVELTKLEAGVSTTAGEALTMPGAGS